MPIYTYRCIKCGNEFDVTQKVGDEPIKECELCKEEVKRVFHPVGIIFKGSGFYSTDNKNKDQKDDSSADKPSAEKSEKTKDKKSPDSAGTTKDKKSEKD